MTYKSLYRNGNVFYTDNPDGTQRIVPSDHEHIFVPADPFNPESEQVCARCTLLATQTA